MSVVDPRYFWATYLAGVVFGATLVLVVLLWAGVARSEEHNHPPQDVQIHEQFYSNWMRPDAPDASCCNKQDCYPTSFKQVGGTWFAQRREDGQWLPIPETKFELNRDSPDGRNHVCMQAPGFSDIVFCAITGGGT